MTDPRFDPRFQRGYTGEGDAPPGGFGSSAGAPAAMRIPEPPASHAPTVPTAEGAEYDDGEHEPHRRNPWLIALWVVSIVLMVVPVLILRRSFEVQSNTNWSETGPPPEYILLQMMMQLGPAVVLMGGIGVLVAICIQAFGWRTRHRRPEAGVGATDEPHA